MKITPKDKVDIINRYQVDLEPMQSIAKRYNVSRQAIWKTLRAAGIDTSKAAANIKTSCPSCGKVFSVVRCRLRKSKNVFCSAACYSAYLEAGNGMGSYISNRHGQRVARSKVAEYIDLKPEYVVHHIDRDCLNNRLDNLMVFACQGDHIRYHRLGPEYSRPVWSGDEPSPAP